MFRRGLTLIEVMVASLLLVISAASILTAFTAGSRATIASTTYQQATMLAGNMMEEIKRLKNYEDGDYAADLINPGVADKAGAMPYQEAGETCSDLGAMVRSCFDDKTDYAGYVDGTGAANGNFVSLSPSAKPLPLGGSQDVMPDMYREVTVVTNDLAETITSGDLLLEVHVVIYEGTAGDADADPELIRLIRIF